MSRILCVLALLFACVGCQNEDPSSSEDTSAPDTAVDTSISRDTGSPDTATDTAQPDTETPDSTSADADTASTDALLSTYPIADPEAYPEAVTYDPQNRAFFTGSMLRGNVLRINADGSESEFFPGNEDGEEWLVLGVEADPTRRRLWVCAAFSRELTRSELWLLDLDSGERLWNLGMEDVFAGAACTDVIVADDGTAYICDREAGNIYTADAQTQSASIFTSHILLDPGTIGGNGIALTADERYLLVIKFLPFKLIRIDMSDPRLVSEVALPNLDDNLPESGGDAIVHLEGLAYIVTNSQVYRATPDDGDWSSASLEVHVPMLEGKPVVGFSGLTVAEGALYASKSDVILFALDLPPQLPFRLHRVEPAVFDATP